MVIAIRQRTAITRVPEDTMTSPYSPYLDSIRSTREILEDLIAAREGELAKTSAAMQRRRVEWDLTFLARITDKAAAAGSRCEPCHSRRIASR